MLNEMADYAAREAAAPELAGFMGGEATVGTLIVAVLIFMAIYGLATYLVMVIQES